MLSCACSSSHGNIVQNMMGNLKVKVNIEVPSSMCIVQYVCILACYDDQTLLHTLDYHVCCAVCLYIGLL